MLRDADRSLANWLSRLLPDRVGLRFDPPDPQWLVKPPESLFVDAFLHGVRRDGRGRQSGWSDLRDGQGRVVARQPAAQYYRLDYLITAWSCLTGGSGGAGDQVMAEHEVLGLVLDGCAQLGVLPDDCLDGALAASGLPTVVDCAPEGCLVTGALWTGLNLAPRAHLELVLVAPARPPVLTDLAPPAREIVLNAEQEATAEPSLDGDVARPVERSFGTTRRWEKQTVIEP